MHHGAMPNTPAVPRPRALLACAVAVVLGVAGCSPSMSPDGKTDAQAQPPAAAQPVDQPTATSGSPRRGDVQTGLASFMADRLDGRKTASGEPYDKEALVAAHPTYPMGTVLRVTNLANGRVVTVTIVDRSARGANRPIIDLSRAAATRLDFIRQGTVKVSIEVIDRPRRQSK